MHLTTRLLAVPVVGLLAAAALSTPAFARSDRLVLPETSRTQVVATHEQMMSGDGAGMSRMHEQMMSDEYGDMTAAHEQMMSGDHAAAHQCTSR